MATKPCLTPSITKLPNVHCRDIQVRKKSHSPLPSSSMCRISASCCLSDIGVCGLLPGVDFGVCTWLPRPALGVCTLLPATVLGVFGLPLGVLGVCRLPPGVETLLGVRQLGSLASWKKDIHVRQKLLKAAMVESITKHFYLAGGPILSSRPHCSFNSSLHLCKWKMLRLCSSTHLFVGFIWADFNTYRCKWCYSYNDSLTFWWQWPIQFDLGIGL